MKFGLLGYPLGHSFSPLIHKKMFELRNVDATYELLEVTKEELPLMLEKLKNNEYSGFNVTIPYKIEIMKHLDYISDEALKIGSVNTVCVKNGKLCGYNTDYYGFKEELEYFNINVKNKDVYVLGTGGASLAIKKAIYDLGGKSISVSRTKTPDNITYSMLGDLSNSIVVNTTPVGMYPNIDGSPLSENLAQNASAIVDIIFNPLKTKLMTFNRNSYNGLAMLVFQALHAQNIWLGIQNIDKNELLDYVRGELSE